MQGVVVTSAPDLRSFISLYGNNSRELLYFDIFTKLEALMSAIDDFNTTFAALSDAVATKVLPALQGIPALTKQVADLTAEVAALTAKVNAQAANDPAIAAAATSVTNMTNALTAAVPA